MKYHDGLLHVMIIIPPRIAFCALPVYDYYYMHCSRVLLFPLVYRNMG